MITASRSITFLTGTTHEKVQLARYERRERCNLRKTKMEKILKENLKGTVCFKESHEKALSKWKILAPWAPRRHVLRSRSADSISFFRTPIQVNFMSFPSVFAIRTQPRSPFLPIPAQKIQIRQNTQI